MRSQAIENVKTVVGSESRGSRLVGKSDTMGEVGGVKLAVKYQSVYVYK